MSVAVGAMHPRPFQPKAVLRCLCRLHQCPVRATDRSRVTGLSLRRKWSTDETRRDMRELVEVGYRSRGRRRASWASGSMTLATWDVWTDQKYKAKELSMNPWHGWHGPMLLRALRL